MNIAVIFAGGVGSRMHSKDKPKQFLLMHGKPIIIHTIEVFQKSKDIDAICIACIEEWIPYLRDLVERYSLDKVKKIVPGGNSAQSSTYNGLLAAKEISNNEKSVVLIHDGVRPIISDKLISDNIQCVIEHGSAITSVPAKETVVIIGNNEKEVGEVLDRSALRIARAPQCFWLDEILEAHRKTKELGLPDFIDSCSMLKYFGKKLYLVDGPIENIKITTPDDFYVLRAILDAKENAQIYGFEE
ncbi:IspD/TarI family cytidylyltransferase [Succinivibrio dextrinosolvens]|uniref:IspD/TarI family cytidylyltransferase n=1 Tax=Succinivibrio dextrinosolvens TaxID=83771 RepID=UPI00192215B5|nr:IspD/TarI family cytidylyltransferase [Succinivibrio dextrinosolvens]